MTPIQKIKSLNPKLLICEAMNVFFLDQNPIIAAQYHCDAHVIKMVLESAQLLCTAHRVLDGRDGQGFSLSGRQVKRWIHPNPAADRLLYASTHVNHQCAIWVRESSYNYLWLATLMRELNNEFMRRYRKTKPHATIEKLGYALKYLPDNIKRGEMTPPALCMPDEYKVEGDPVQSYRNFYCGAKARFATWTNAPVPEWFKPVEG